MAKEKNSSKIPKKEDEYRLEEEYTEPEPSGKPKRNWSAILLNRRLIAVVAVIIAVFVVYQFIKTPTVSREIKQAEQPTIQPTMQPSTITTTTTQLTPTVTPPPQVQPIVVQPQPPEERRVEATSAVVSGQAPQNAADIRDLRTSMQQVQGQVTQITNQLSTLTNSINALSTKALCPIPPVKVAPVKPAPIKFVVPRRIYFVRALVPGRAWLHATDGHLTTVKVGDSLRGYGRIQLINPSEGKVYTSSGDVIRYGANDS